MPQWQLDLRYPLKCQDNAFDGVFSEHVLEHLYIDDALALLREIYRILKPGGTLRLTVPSLDYRIQCYLEEKASGDSLRIALASDMIRNLTQEYLHLSVWDYDRLAYELESLGFVSIKRSSYGNGRDPLILFDLKERAYESLYIEASKRA